MKKLNLIWITLLMLIVLSSLANATLEDDTIAYYKFDNTLTDEKSTYTFTTGGFTYDVNGYLHQSTKGTLAGTDHLLGNILQGNWLSSTFWVHKNTGFAFGNGASNTRLHFKTSTDDLTYWKVHIQWRDGGTGGDSWYTDHEVTYSVVNNSDWVLVYIGLANGNTANYDTIKINNEWTTNTTIYSSNPTTCSREYTDGLDVGYSTSNTANTYHDTNIDELKFYNRHLTSIELTNIFNGVADNFTITTNLADYNISLVSNNETQTITSSSTTYETNLSSTDTRLWNITLSATNYQDKTFTNYNISVNGSLSTSLLLNQYDINFTATQIITSNTVTDFNITLQNGTIFNNSVTYYIDYGTQNITFSKEGYYNLTQEVTIDTNKTLTFTDVYNNLLNVSVNSLPGNSSINTYSGYVTYGAIRYNYTTTTGETAIPLVQGLNYSVFFDGGGSYASANTTLIPNATNTNQTFYVYNFNSVRINIYNQTDSSLMSQAVTIITIRDGLSFYNYTSNGTIILDFLTPEDYELRFSSLDFQDRSMYITVYNDSTQEINVYMTINATTEVQVVEVLDTSNAAVEGAVVWLQKEQLNSTTQWITIQEALTNNEGQTAVYVDRSTSIYYRFAVIVDGVAVPIEPNGNYYTTKTIFIPGITETVQITINLEEV